MSHCYGVDDELAGVFQGLSLGKGYSGRQFPEWEEELGQRPRSSARRAAPPEEGPCACVSNQAVRRRLGVQGDPSVDIDHIFERHRAEVRGWNADIEGNKELAPATLNRRWGQLYRYGNYEQLEKEKREYHGDDRYEEAYQAVRNCNKKYNYHRR